MESENCDHSITFDDNITGDSVCLKCGLVLEVLQGVSNLVVEELVEEVTKNARDKDWAAAFFLDVCSNLNLNDSIARDSALKFKALLRKAENKSLRRKDIAAYSLYAVILRHGVGKTAEEIALFAGVQVKSIWHVERENPLNVEERAENYVNKFCYFVGLTRRDAAKVYAALQHTDLLDSVEGCRPQNIAVAVISMYCEKYVKHFKLGEICQICGVSVASIRKIVKHLNKIKICI